jgi:hypothetical protein
MPEWWTYRLDDFLMFSPRTYWRLIELYNRELWPWQVVALAGGAGLLHLSARGRARWIVFSALAIAWAWVGWGFHWQRYATINWGARYVAGAFALQAGLLLAAAMLHRGAGPPEPARGERTRRVGLVLAACGVLLYPLLAVIAARPWTQAEVFGLAPEPTALATLGLLLAAPGPRRPWLFVIPVLSLALGAATMWLVR